MTVLADTDLDKYEKGNSGLPGMPDDWLTPPVKDSSLPVTTSSLWTNCASSAAIPVQTKGVHVNVG